MGLIDSKDEVDFLVDNIDPFNMGQMTYSDIIQLLSSHMVIDNLYSHHFDQEPVSIPLLEKYSNMYKYENNIIENV